MERRSVWMDDAIAAFAETARRFVEREAMPHRVRWAGQGFVDRAFWRRAGAAGLLCPSIPAEYGGGGGTLAHDLVVFRAPLVATETGFGIGNAVHSGVVAHYVLAYGSEEQRQRWLPGMADGSVVGAIAITEPGAGSDLQRLRTTAIRDGNHYVVNGSKTFISNGSCADLVILMVQTRPGAGAAGISLLLVDTARTEGFRVGRRLSKIGLPAQDTAELYFTDMRVRATDLLGAEGAGFGYVMTQLARERLLLADSAVAVAEAGLAETVRYTKEHRVLDTPLFATQHTRFELARCAISTRTARAFVDECVRKALDGTLDIASASMAKAHASEVQGDVLDRCLQLFGEHGLVLDRPIARMYADARAQRIYGGANEIMKELIARSL